MTKKEIAKEILEANGGGTMTTHQMAEYALANFGRYVQGDVEVLKNQLSSAMSQDIRNKKTKSPFRKIKNKSGGHQRGKYRLKKKSCPRTLTLQPTVNSLYTGKAGEQAVLSELLFYGYNASIMTVDDGIDIVASKNNKYFHIQVKTSNSQEGSNKFQFTIKKDKFDQMSSGSIFYVLVMRRSNNKRHFNDFVVFSSPEIKSFLDREVIRDAKSLSIRIEAKTPGEFLLNGRENIFGSVNKFNRIK